MNTSTITFGAERLTIEDVVAIAKGADAALNNQPNFIDRIHKGANFLDKLGFVD